MIPDRVIEMLSGPSFVQIATRDESLRPAHTYAIGALVHEDRQTVTVLVPTARAARILPHLESNGRVAVGIAQASHEAYQLKGTYLATRPTDANDLARQETYRKALLADAHVAEALWWWQFSYVSSWGNLAGATLNALLSVVAHDRLDAEFTGEDEDVAAANEMLDEGEPLST